MEPHSKRRAGVWGCGQRLSLPGQVSNLEPDDPQIPQRTADVLTSSGLTNDE